MSRSTACAGRFSCIHDIWHFTRLAQDADAGVIAPDTVDAFSLCSVRSFARITLVAAAMCLVDYVRDDAGLTFPNS